MENIDNIIEDIVSESGTTARDATFMALTGDKGKKRGRPPKEGGASLVMTPAEILREYQTAKNPAAQIKILADMNGVTEGDIKRILINQGVDSRTLPRKTQKASMQKKPVSSDVISYLEKERSILTKRLTEIEQLIPSLEAEKKHIDLKLGALQQARAIIAEVYGGE